MAEPANGTGAGRVLGTVAGLWCYPVKSMAGLAMDVVDCGWHGVRGDRRWTFVRAGAKGSGFPWLTSRRNHRLAQYVPAFADPTQPDRCRVTVRSPGGATFDVADDALAAELGEGVFAMKQDVGVFDTFPLSLISTQSIGAIAERVGEPLAVERFRPNLLVEAEGGQPFAEDAWVGASLQIGESRVRIDKRDERCMVVNLDPKTSQSTPAVLKTIAQERQGCLGVYGSVAVPGSIRIGDRVVVHA